MNAHVLQKLIESPEATIPADLVQAAQNLATLYGVPLSQVKLLRCTGPDTIFPEDETAAADLVTLEGAGRLQLGVEFTGARGYCPGTVARLATRHPISVAPTQPSTFALMPPSATRHVQFEFGDRRDPLAM
jgi:hypothetical protein